MALQCLYTEEEEAVLLVDTELTHQSDKTLTMFQRLDSTTYVVCLCIMFINDQCKPMFIVSIKLLAFWDPFPWCERLQAVNT